MEKDTHFTHVLFRRFPKREGGEVIALMPYLLDTYDPRDGTCVSFMHVGEHGNASVYLTQETKAANIKDQDVIDLFEELENRGYRLKVIQRVNRQNREKAIAQAYVDLRNMESAT